MITEIKKLRCTGLLVKIQYGGFIRACTKKSGNMIRHQVRILYLLFLWFQLSILCFVNLCQF